ncbi:hypothetical protein N9966_00420 [bacterium]|nr:hypothetical protein [bacterium]
MVPKKKIYNHSFLGGLGKLKFFDEDGNLLCYKTQTFLEAGYVYAPYVPMIDPSEFKPKRSLMSRYAQRVVNNSFYGIIEHDGAE